MNDDPLKTAMSQLGQLLDDERNALLAGQIDRVVETTSKKEALIEIINAHPAVPGDALPQLHQKMTRNQALLDGALSGIRRVSARLAAFRKIKQTLETYDAQGQRRSISADRKSKVERRA